MYAYLVVNVLYQNGKKMGKAGNWAKSEATYTRDSPCRCRKADSRAIATQSPCWENYRLLARPVRGIMPDRPEENARALGSCPDQPAHMQDQVQRSACSCRYGRFLFFCCAIQPGQIHWNIL